MRPPVRLLGIGSAVLAASVLWAPSAVAAPLDPFGQVTVGGQPATGLVASYPTGEQATSVMSRAACLGSPASCASTSTDYSRYAAYYGDRTTGGFTMRPGFVSGVGAEYAGVGGGGSFTVSVSSYATARQTLRAARQIADGAGITLRKVASGVTGPEPWGTYDVWTGTAAGGDQGIIYAIDGARYARVWAYPSAAKGWTRAQWRVAFQGFAAILPQVMGARQQFTVTPDLEALLPATPPSLIPVFYVSSPKSTWLPYGRPDDALYAAMSPSVLSLQYAIVGAPETLGLTASITPVSDVALAQGYVDRLPSDPLASGPLVIDGLPPGAQAVHVDQDGVERLIYVQFVARGSLNELTCSDLSITSDLVTGRAACLSAIRDAAAAMSS